MPKRHLPFLSVALPITAVATVALLVFVATTGAGPRIPATTSFSIFANESASPAAVAVSPRTAALTRGDLGATRLLGSQLGRFQSKLFAYPGNSDRNICFGIRAERMTDPGATTCYSPTRENHFNVMALEAVTAGGVGVQLFGVADDQVTDLRAHVDGQWQSVSLQGNGFYLDLPGVRHEEVGLVEATLKDGTTQVHDIQTGK